MAAVPPSAEHALDPAADFSVGAAAWRTALRREKLAAREAMDAATRTAANARIAEALKGFLATLVPRCIAFCAAVRGEFDAAPLVAGLVATGWSAVMPVAVAPARAMAFRRWAPDAAMDTDRHGIPVPAVDERATPDLVLLPLVAFDTAGYRLGYGGGYFDRTLAALDPRPLAIGVGYELARVPDLRPQVHDIRLDRIVTEAGMFGTGKS